MIALSLLALVVGALVGYLATNFQQYIWTLDGVIYAHKWAATLLACLVGVAIVRISGGIVHYFFDSRSRAEKLAAEMHSQLKAELASEFKKAKKIKDGLTDLHERHSEIQRRINEEEKQLKYRNRQLTEKLKQADALLAELDHVKASMATGPANDGRRRREQGKVDRIVERAEALKKEVVSERG